MKVVSVEDGKQAVDFMRSPDAEEIDLILMDVMMPEMDGYEATREIRALPNADIAQKPIIAMTANAFEEDVKKAMDSGMSGHLSKPLRLDRLFEMMHKFLN